MQAGANAMTKKEQELINACRNLPKSVYGNYHYGEELVEVIGKVMGYRIIHFTVSSSDPHDFMTKLIKVLSCTSSFSMFWKTNAML